MGKSIQRATTSDVARELYVYEVKEHYDDEGGPISFGADWPIGGRRKNWTCLLDAVRDGVAIHLRPDIVSKRRRATLPIADCSLCKHWPTHFDCC